MRLSFNSRSLFKREGAAKPKQKLEAKHPIVIRWNHWINFPALAVMIWSGLLIYWANDVYSVPIPGMGKVPIFHEAKEADPDSPTPKGLIPYVAAAPSFLPQSWSEPNPDDPSKPRVIYNLKSQLAEGMAYHFFFMWFFTINGIVYVLYSLISGQWRYLVPQKGTIKHAVWTVLHDLHLKKPPPPRQKFNGAQQIAYTSIILMGAGSALTGLAIYKPTQFGWLIALFGGYGAARFIHFWLVIGYMLFFLIHVAQVVRAGWNNFRAMVTGYELVPIEEAANG
jgi:thiosulfate reductase cytochrome b subunit